MDNNKRLSELLGVPDRDWTSSDGKIELLRLLREREDWEEFAMFIANGLDLDEWIDLFMDKTGKLALLALAWLGQQEGGKE